MESLRGTPHKDMHFGKHFLFKYFIFVCLFRELPKKQEKKLKKTKHDSQCTKKFGYGTCNQNGRKKKNQ